MSMYDKMMSEGWKCPMCGKVVFDYPALSRRDNKTDICSQCGTKEALDDFFNQRRERKWKQ